MSSDDTYGNEPYIDDSLNEEYLLKDFVKTHVILNLSSGHFNFLLPNEHLKNLY